MQQHERTAERSAPVIGGEPTPAEMYAATGALLYDGEFGCTATLIAPDVVITAAHCFAFAEDVAVSFTLAVDANDVLEAQTYPVVSFTPHPSFDIGDEPPPGVQQVFDIGIALLDRPVPETAYEILPNPEEAEELVAGAQVELVGYGVTTEDAEAAGVKHHGAADLVEVGDYELLVAQPGQQQNCHGDSGGPGFVDLNGERRLVGIVSRSPNWDEPGCHLGGIDTRVDSYLPWLHEVAGDKLSCGTGLNEPCPGDGGCNSSDGGGGLGLALLGLLLLAARRRVRLSGHG